MRLEFFIYGSFILFLLSFFGLIFIKGFARVVISLQVLIFSGIINFLSFSFILYQGSFWDKIFLMLGLVCLYLFLFCIIFYAHFKAKDNEILKYFNKLNFFETGRSSWWGEDKA